MKKVLVGILIGVVVLAGGCMAMVGGAANSISDSITSMEEETAKKDEVYQTIANNIAWEVERSEFSSKIVGILENTLEEAISYIEFDYKTFDKEGVTLESSFTNEVDIAPGEKRKVEILIIDDSFATYEIKVKSSAL